MNPDHIMYAVLMLALIVLAGLADTLSTIAVHKLAMKTQAPVEETALWGWANPFALDPANRIKVNAIVFLLWIVGFYTRSTSKNELVKIAGFSMEALGLMIGIAHIMATANNLQVLLKLIDKLPPRL